MAEIILKPGERILRSEEGVDVSFKGEVSLGKVLMFGVVGLAMRGKKVKGGTLYLTNKRLVYAARVGRIRKKTVVPMDCPLENISFCDVEKGLLGGETLKVTVSVGGKTADFKFKVSSPSAWAEDIRKAIAELES